MSQKTSTARPARLSTPHLRQSDFELSMHLVALDTAKFNSPLEGKRIFCADINSDSEKLDVERYSHTRSHGTIPLSQ